MKNTKSLIVGLICSVLITTTALAVTIPNESRFFPEREGVPYVHGEQGFPYPTFNNFINNPNILSGGRAGDERQFLVGKHCVGGVAGCPGELYFNTLTQPLQEGDVVRFELYFHNNAEDPYDGGSVGSPNAEDVRVGVQFNDIVDPVYDDLLRPKGFIYADNNQYLVDPDDKDNVTVNQSTGKISSNHELFRDANTNSVIRYAYDDMQTFIAEYGMYLEPVEGSTWLTMLLDDGNSVYFDGPITGPTNLTFETVDPNTVTLLATPGIDSNKIFLDFEELPGCFRYSGFVYFDAIVKVEEPICDELLVDHPETIYEGTHSRFNSSALNTDGDNFESDIIYWVDEGYGTLSLNPPTDVPANPSDYIFERVFNLLPINPIQVQLFTFKEVINKIAETGILDRLFGNVAHAITLEPAIDPGELFGGQDPEIFFNLPDITQLTVPQGTPVYLTATNPGIHGVFHAKTVDSEVATCARDFDILPYRVCEEILVDHHETIADDGTLSQFAAVSLNPAEDIFYGKITYSVDPGYGQFFETKPTGYDDNTSQYIVEIPAGTFPAPVPQGGWCSDVGSQNSPGGSIDPGVFILPEGQIAPEIMGDWFWEGIDPGILGGWAEQNEGLFLDPGVMLEGGIMEMGGEIMEMGAIQGFNSVLHAANAEAIDPYTINVSPGQTVWFLPAQPGVDVIHVSTNCTNSTECGRDFSIEPVVENACASLEIISSTQPLELSNTLTTNLIVVSTDLNGDPLPNNTQLQWTTDTGATFSYAQVSSLNSIIAELIEIITANNFQTTGTITVEMADINDPLYSAICTDSIPVSELLICTDITVQDSGVTLVELNPGELYELTADAAYSGTPASEEVTYTSTQGLFLGPVSTNPLIRLATRTLVNDILAGTISSNWINEPIPASLLAQLSQSITVNDGELVFFVTFTDATGTDALTVQATNRGEAACVKSYDMAVQDQPCESIEVTYSPTPFNPEVGTIIVVQPGIYGDWAGEFTFSAPNGTFSVPGGAPKLNFTQTEAAGGITYIPDANPTDADEITITATGPLNGGGVCNYVISPNPEDVECLDLSIVQPAGIWDEDDFTDNDEQRFRIEVETDPAGFEDTLTYRWEEDENSSASFRYSTTDHTSSNPLINYLEDINTNDDASVTVYAVDENGDPIAACRDTANFNVDDDNPGIDKVVYDPISRDWENVVNYGGRDDDGDFIDPKYEWITYLSVFDPDGVSEAQLWEDELDDGNIESANLGSAGGELLFQGMIIAVEDNNGDQYVIYQDAGFETGRFRNEDDILDTDLEDFEDFDEDDLEDKYDCDTGSENDRVCIEDYEDALINFQRGDHVEFQNMEDTKYMYVFYQMENRTEIDEEFCKTMIEDFGTCGEEFENEINFETPEGHEGKDNAKVVVVCPYILVREGGDIFFHDAIDTGIDVSACYEVEGGEGGTYRPTKEDDGDVVSTGQGEAEGEVTLIAPSHDLCKISNTEESDLEAYRNIFKNFSSSVCEMETEVAEQWKEVHINNAIKANIEKLARFGVQNTITNEIHNITTLQNGVHITTGDLTIDSRFDVPAGARTYIVQGADLIINANVLYNDNAAGVDITKPTTIPSVAFVVIDGNIIIDGDVTHLDGIYMAVDTEGDEDGMITATEVSYKLLTIQGSLVGDIYELYKNRKGVGDPLKDESSITVKYDQRILLNTAPGLNELIDISQLEVAN
ncbi:MAG: hypothetical protein ABID64_02590 [Nitrospirota bacterium]